MHWTNQNWAKSDIIEYNWEKTGQKTKKKTGQKTRQKAGQTDKNQKATYKTAAELAVKNKRSFSSFVNYQSFVVHQKSALCFLMFTFCWGNKPLIGQSTKTFSVFEELKTKQNKFWIWANSTKKKFCYRKSFDTLFIGIYASNRKCNTSQIKEN